MKLFIRQSRAFWKRDLIDSASYKSYFLSQFLNSFAHLLIFFFIAQLVGEKTEGYLHLYGGEYFPFVLVGIIFSTYEAAALSSLAKAVSKELTHGTLEAVLMTPVSPARLFLTVAFGDMVMASLRAILFLTVAAVLFGVHIASMNIVATLVMILATTAALLGFGFISSGFLVAFKKGDPISLILNGASKLLAGVYFPVQIFPAGIQKISDWLPMTYALEGLRKAILQGKSIVDLTPEISFLFLVAAVMIPTGVLFFNQMVLYAKKEGSLIFS